MILIWFVSILPLVALSQDIPNGHYYEQISKREARLMSPVNSEKQVLPLKKLAPNTIGTKNKNNKETENIIIGEIKDIKETNSDLEFSFFNNLLKS